MSANVLGRAASPYLLQHANNPVHWRMWRPAALQEAETLNKPILLSIGYAACHWCPLSRSILAGSASLSVQSDGRDMP